MRSSHLKFECGIVIGRWSIEGLRKREHDERMNTYIHAPSLPPRLPSLQLRTRLISPSPGLLDQQYRAGLSFNCCTARHARHPTYTRLPITVGGLTRSASSIQTRARRIAKNHQPWPTTPTARLPLHMSYPPTRPRTSASARIASPTRRNPQKPRACRKPRTTFMRLSKSMRIESVCASNTD